MAEFRKSPFRAIEFLAFLTQKRLGPFPDGGRSHQSAGTNTANPAGHGTQKLSWKCFQTELLGLKPKLQMPYFVLFPKENERDMVRIFFTYELE